MLDLGALGEVLIIILAALILFGPKEIPELVRVAGKWLGKLRKFSQQVHKTVDDVITESEIENFKRDANKPYEKEIRDNMRSLEKDE